MCGIAGVIAWGGRPVERSLLEGLCARLVHRGPDEEGFHFEPGVGLGQRRLSIIDLSTGKQPMANEDGTIWLTFNGEIYNYQELRPTLEKQGHRFATHSDTETILHAYEEYGTSCLEHFRGMFAFGLWDSHRKQVFLARDRLGKKPLFYAVLPNQLAFASELQALVEHPGIERRLDPIALDHYLAYGYIPAPRTIYQGIHKLPPAHWLTARPRGDGSAIIDVEPYWRLSYTPKQHLTEEEAIEGLLEVLTEAVRLRMIADVPLGALLSGGIDSSLVVALMSRLSDRPVKTFSIGFDEREFNELPYARLVAQQYGTEHHELIVRPSAAEVLPTLVRHYGEPYADSSAIPSYFVSKMTRAHVKVALNGDGGDESFGGYERYLGNELARTYERLPRLLRHGVIQPLAALVPDSLPRRNRLRQAKRFVTVAARPFRERYQRWVSTFPANARQTLYTGAFRDQLAAHDGDEWLTGQFDHVAEAGIGQLDALLAVDVRSYLPYDLLVKMDIATMANSLEARSPFLDHKVMEFAARLPEHYKLRGRTLKYLLKKLGAKLLPPENLKRRKMGFGVPVGRWMQYELRPLLEETLFSAEAINRGYFRTDAIRRMVTEHAHGRQDHTYQLWSLLWLELWHREFMP